MTMLRIASQLGKISSDYSGKAAQTQSSTQVLLIQTSRIWSEMFQTCAFALDQSLHLLFLSPGQWGHLAFSDEHKSMWDETIFFFYFLGKLRWTCRQRQTGKRNQRRKKKQKTQQFPNSINTHNSTINNQNPGTLHHECHRPRRDDR